MLIYNPVNYLAYLLFSSPRKFYDFSRLGKRVMHVFENFVMGRFSQVQNNSPGNNCALNLSFILVVNSSQHILSTKYGMH